MFTGLVEAKGQIVAVHETPTGRRLEIDSGTWGHEPDLGASISVSGCCLTVVEVAGARLTFDVVHRTLEITTLGGLAVGDPVNLEKSATLDTLLGGHLVQGHVDGIGTTLGVDAGDDWRLRIAAPPTVSEHLVDRGSITVDGVSLTVARVLRAEHGAVEGFEVALIPETLARTTLSDRRVGDQVNLEADAMSKMIASHVERLLASGAFDRIGRPPSLG
jgi:riboflavin synthase